jgi:hypothetical protein
VYDTSGMKTRLRRFSRRFFLRACSAVVGTGLVSAKIPRWFGSAFAGTGETQNPLKTEKAPRRLIYIAIDALHPNAGLWPQPNRS